MPPTKKATSVKSAKQAAKPKADPNKINITKFVQTGVKAEYQLLFQGIDADGASPYDLYDLFNDFTVSAEVPYMVLRNGETEIFHKAVENFYTIPESTAWVSTPPKSIMKKNVARINTGMPDIYFYRLAKSDGMANQTAVQQYDPGFINIARDSNRIVLTMDIFEDNDDIRKFLAHFSDLKFQDLKEINKTQKIVSIKGVFAVPYHTVGNCAALLDLISCDPKYNKVYYVDEMERMTTEKRSKFFMYKVQGSKSTAKKTDEPAVKEADEPRVNFILSAKKVGPIDYDKFEPKIELFSPYVNVHIASAADISALNEFIENFSNLMETYVKKWRSIMDDYKEILTKSDYTAFEQNSPNPYLGTAASQQAGDGDDDGDGDSESPKSKVAAPKKPSKKSMANPANMTPINRLKRANFEVFGNPGYSRTCQPHRQPYLMEPEEEENIVEDPDRPGMYKLKDGTGYVMRYPNEDPDEENTRNVRYYKCPGNDPRSDQEYVYVAMSENHSKGEDGHDFPCCFKVDKYNEVKKTEAQKAKAKKDKGVDKLSSEKILSVGSRGLLPKNIVRVLENIFGIGNTKYHREGGSITRYSFLSCVLRAKFKTQYVDDVQMDVNAPTVAAKKASKKASISIDTRQFLQTEILPRIGMGTFSENQPAATVDQVVDILQNGTIDSKKFTSLLENILGVKIIVFHRPMEESEINSSEDANGAIEIPDRMFGFMWRPVEVGTPVVAIYKHYGGTADMATQPHYELISHKRTSDKIYNYEFIPSAATAQQLNELMSKKAYQLQVVGDARNAGRCNEFSTPVSKGIFDSAGKCRGLCFVAATAATAKDAAATANNSPVTMYFYQPMLLPGKGAVCKDVRNCVGTIGAVETLASRRAVDAFIKTEGPDQIEIVQYDTTPASEKAKPRVIVGYQVRIADPEGGWCLGYIPFTPEPYSEAKPNKKIATGERIAPFYSTDDGVIVKTERNRRLAMFLTQTIAYHFAVKMKPSYIDLLKTLARKLRDAANTKAAEKEDSKIGKAYDEFEDALQTDLVEKYFKDYVMVKSGHDYGGGEVPRCLSCNTNFFDGKTGKMILPSADVKRRFKNYIEILIKSHTTLFNDIPTKIKGYFSSASDFKQVRGQAIFAGTKSFQNWLDSMSTTIKYGAMVETAPRTWDAPQPYFLRSWTLTNSKCRYNFTTFTKADNSVGYTSDYGCDPITVLVQHVESKLLKDALHVSKTFYNDGINVGYNATSDDSEPDRYYICEYMGAGFLVKMVTPTSIKVVPDLKSDLPAVLKYGETDYAALMVVVEASASN